MKITNVVIVSKHNTNNYQLNKKLNTKNEPQKATQLPSFCGSLYANSLSFCGKKRTNHKKRIDYLAQYGIDKEYSERIARMDKERYEKAVHLLSEGVRTECLEEVVSLNPLNYKQALQLVKRGVFDSHLHLIASYDKDKFIKALEYMKNGIDYDCINLFMSLSPEEEKEALALISQGHPPIIAGNLAKLNEKEKITALNLLEFRADIEVASTIAQYDEEKKRKCINYIQQGIDPEFVSEIAEIKQENEGRIQYLITQKAGDSNIGDIASLSDEEYNKAISMLKSSIYADSIIPILEIENGTTENEEYYEYLSRGYSKTSSLSISLLSNEEIDQLSALIDKNPDIKKHFEDEYEVSIVSLQNDDENEVILTKEMRTENGTKITLVRTFDGYGQSTQSRTEEYTDNSTSSIMSNRSGTFRAKYDKYGELKELTEFIQDPEIHNVVGIIHTKASKILEGAFESNYYDISQIKESGDESKILAGIEESIIGEGETISKVSQEDDGTIKYVETLQINEFLVDRIYTEKRNENGEIIHSTYSYKIQEEDRKEPLMDIYRSFKLNDDNSVDNEINSVKYHIEYDDENKIICISDGENKRVLNMKEKLPLYSREILWGEIKKLHVDTILTIYDNVKQWNHCLDEDSSACSYMQTLSTGKNISVITHEAGHLQTNKNESILEDEEFVQSYGEEMESFKLSIPYNEQNFVQYFSPRADLMDSEGDSEFIAEANILLTSYGTAYPRIKTRTQFLEKYFPRTIARVAQITGKTSTESLLK